MEIREMEENPGREQETGLAERFAAIEEILDAMEKPEATLEQSFALYQQGLKELNAANSMLDEMEKTMLVMMEDGSLEEF
ncbi:MAG: exodeoxyribonuclease VII small subunit [Muribaculaceae bacterium]|nr:exodeoxyribonuclease VII small subunit [Roseburia sp.]MCM1430512.1 exodeoxyribonuclease VII small subunit [Muribaculaceae bacterium]MCM1493185.1 exodeoxyribonuclease VII small subunit [Muribaculaceae bacterium]